MSYLRVLLVVSAFLAAVVKPQSTSGTSAADLEVAVFKTCQDEPILNISWDTPSDNETISSYELQISLAINQPLIKCQQNYTSIFKDIPSSETSFVVAGSDRLQLDCNYAVTLVTKPSDQEMTIEFTASVEPTVITHSCTAVLEELDGTYNISLLWSLLKFSGNLSRIKDFNATLFSPVSPNMMAIIVPQNEDLNYQWTLANLPALVNAEYTFQLALNYIDNCSEVVVMGCNVSAPITPPGIVTSVAVLELDIPNHRNARLNVSWDEPIPNGELSYYQVWIGQSRLEGLDDIDASTVLINKTFPSNVTNTSEYFVVPHGVDEIYFQVRSTNNHCERLEPSCISNWSMPIALNTLQCHRNMETTIQAPSQHENSIVSTAQCFAACVDEHAASRLQNTGTWSSVSIADLTCEELAKVKECQRGCSTYMADPNLERLYCEDKCYTDCKLECNNTLECTTNINNGCKQLCRYRQCEIGCMIHETIQSIKGLQQPQSIRNISLKSTQSDDGGLFSVVGTPDDQQSNSTLVDHAFVVKIEDDNSTVYYLWMSSLSEVLDLKYFMCREINVSMSVVNRNGTSPFTNAISVFVYGETRGPEQIRTRLIEHTAREDLRPGFFKHAILNISWPRPASGFEYLTHYELTIRSSVTFRPECIAMKQFIINRNDTNIIVQSETPSDKLPRFECQYNIKLVAEPSFDAVVGEQIIRSLAANVPKKELKISCTRVQNPDNGFVSFQATWTLPNDTTTLEATHSFISFKFLANSNFQTIQPIFGLQRRILAMPDKLTYTETSLYLPRKPGTVQYFQFRITTVYRPQLKWRVRLPITSCFVNIFSDPPTPIESDNITMAVHEYSDSLINTTVNWQPPVINYGTSRTYDAIISSEPLEVDSDSLSSVIQIKSTTLTEATFTVRLPQGINCVYFQVRTTNEFEAVSNWSAPVVIPGCLIASPTPSPSNIISESFIDSSVSPSITPTPIVMITNLQSILIYSAAGIFVLLFAICVISLLLCGCFFSRRKIELMKALEGPEADNIFKGKQNSSQLGTSQNPYSLKVDQWELQYQQISMQEQMSEGFFGKVYKGYVSGPLKNPNISPALRNSANIPVAIKLLKSSSAGIERKDFLNEIDILKKISEGNNTNVIEMVGCVTLQEPVKLITVLAEHGDLLSYLKYFRDLLPANTLKKTQSEELMVQAEHRNSIAPEKESPYSTLGQLGSDDLLSFAYQIASGMDYLTSLDIIHRDLACRNVLVCTGKVLKISDFGMARVIASDDVYVKSSRGRLPWKWLAIESICMRDFSSASDVWSYGVTLWEIATLGGSPYPSVPNTDLLEHLQRGGRLEKPEHTSTEVYNIMQQCWSAEPKERPNFSELRAKFDSLILAEKSDAESYIDLLKIDLRQPYYNIFPVDEGDDQFFVIPGMEQPYDHLSDELLGRIGITNFAYKSSSESPPATNTDKLI